MIYRSRNYSCSYKFQFLHNLKYISNETWNLQNDSILKGFTFSTAVSYFIELLNFTDFFFKQIEGLLQSSSSKSVGTIFPVAFVYLVSMCHMLAVLGLFQSFSLLGLSCWSMICDPWCYYGNCFGAKESHPNKEGNLTEQCYVCSNCPTY